MMGELFWVILQSKVRIKVTSWPRSATLKQSNLDYFKLYIERYEITTFSKTIVVVPSIEKKLGLAG